MKSILALTRKNSSIRRNRCASAGLCEFTSKDAVALSVVIPTYNRAYQLDSCLGLLFKQSYPRWKYEVIVVDDNSNDETPKVLGRYSMKYPNLKVIRNKENKGPYYSRNLGVSLSKGEIVIFTDSDCMFPSDWLLKMEKAFQDREVFCVQGTQEYRGKFAGLEAEGDLFLKMLQKLRGLDTKNLGIRRDLILKYRFDEACKVAGDRELGQRLAIDHIEVIYDPHISVVHSPTHSVRDQISRAKEWGKSYAYIYLKYGWKGSNPRFRYPFPLLFFFYLGSFPYFLLKLRSLRGTIAFTVMLLVVCFYFKISTRKGNYLFGRHLCPLSY